jgi:hypothetical protein
MPAFASWTTVVLAAVALVATAGAASSPFEDRSDPLFTCPAVTTCPVICVENHHQCPTACEYQGFSLCQDGTCTTESCDAAPENPCPSCKPFACTKVTKDFDDCMVLYGDFYISRDLCEQFAELEKGSFQPAPLSVLGLWLGAVIIGTLVWCRLNRLPDATRALEQGRTQTGYRESKMGRILYASVVLTVLGFQFLLLGFSVSSYHQNEVDALRGFEVAWSIGYIYTLAMKWPISIQSLFRECCLLEHATQICVFTEKQAASTSMLPAGKREANYLSFLRCILNVVSAAFACAMNSLFSVPYRGHGMIHYVEVQIDEMGTRFFVFQFRRYIYDAAQDSFLPGKVSVDEDTLGHFVSAQQGLARDEVERRRRAVGPNVIQMQRPSFFRCISNEFNKAFYAYQLYILWSWVPLYFFYMAVIHGSVILSGGLCVSWFRYRNETNLYLLTHTDGDVIVRRNNTTETIRQEDLVPGDVVHVEPGQVYMDMVVISSQGLLVDESALTGESNPVAKTAVKDTDLSMRYHPLTHKKHTVSAGTTVMEAEVDQNWAVVVATGSWTSKGELLRDVFRYERHQFKFDVEVGFVIALLFFYSMFCFGLVLYFISEQPVYAWFYGM